MTAQKTAYEMGTAYLSAPTAWSAASKPQPAPAKAPEPAAASTPAQAPEAMPDNQWGAVDFFAKRAMAAVEAERQMADIFSKRITYARQLVDAVRRRDARLAQDATEAWYRTEILLVKIMDEYEPIVKERKSVLRQLQEMGRGRA